MKVNFIAKTRNRSFHFNLVLFRSSLWSQTFKYFCRQWCQRGNRHKFHPVARWLSSSESQMLKTRSWQVDWQWPSLHFGYEPGTQKQRAGFFRVLGLGSFARQLPCLQLCTARGAVQNSSHCWWVTRRVLGSKKPCFLYRVVSSFCLSTHSFIYSFN